MQTDFHWEAGEPASFVSWQYIAEEFCRVKPNQPICTEWGRTVTAGLSVGQGAVVVKADE